jgi:hypothetical protein
VHLGSGQRNLLIWLEIIARIVAPARLEADLCPEK